MTRKIDDIKLVWDDVLMECDLSFDEDVQDLETSTGLQTAVIISLFTDRRAKQDDVLPDPTSFDRRGWWGDLTSSFENDQIGSRLWLLERAKTTSDIPQKAKKYAEEALQWLVDDGVAAKIEVSAERQPKTDGGDVLALSVKIFKTDGSKEIMEFAYQWNTQKSRS